MANEQQYRKPHVFDPISNDVDECECGLVKDAEIHETDEQYEQRMKPRIVNAPERIWLQTGCDDGVGAIDWKELAHEEVSWCDERIDRTDIEYVRADLVSSAAALPAHCDIPDCLICEAQRDAPAPPVTEAAAESDAQKDVDAFWLALERSWEIEPRSYFEKEAPHNGFGSPLAMAVHYMWKREVKQNAAESSEAAAVAAREIAANYEVHKDRCHSNERYPSPPCDCGAIGDIAAIISKHCGAPRSEGHHLPNYLWCERCQAWIETGHVCGAQYVDKGDHYELVQPAATPTAPSAGMEAIRQERLRQIESEKWTPEHDDDHEDGELAQAANCYWELGNGSFGQNAPDADQSDAEMPDGWPWDEDWWKPKTRLRNLVRAGALYQAEIDRLVRRRNEVAEEINNLTNGAPSTEAGEPK